MDKKWLKFMLIIVLSVTIIYFLPLIMPAWFDEVGKLIIELVLIAFMSLAVIYVR